MDHTICHFEIPVDDLGRAAEFYRGLFGVEISSCHDPNVPVWSVHTVPVDGTGRPTRQGVNGMLIKKHHPQHAFANYVSVENVDDYLKKAVELGGQVALPKTPVPGMGWFAYFKDTEGTTLGLWQLDPATGPA